MVANFMAPDSGPPSFSGKDWFTFPAYSQAPLLAWGVERVYARNRDLELVRQSLKGLEAFHDWYWRERDLDEVGVVTVGSYDGVVQDNIIELPRHRHIASSRRKRRKPACVHQMRVCPHAASCWVPWSPQPHCSA